MVEKSNDIVSYLEDNMDAIIKDELTVKEIADKFNVTKQLVCYRIDRIDDTVFEQRDMFINEKLEIIRHQIMEGIPLETIFEQKFAQNFLTKRGKESIHRAKDLILNRMRSRGIVDDKDEINRYTVVKAKLKNYVNILQIEHALNNSDELNTNKAEISRLYHASYVKVLEISKDMKKSPEYRALQNLPQGAYKTMIRNIKMTIQYQKGASLSDLNEQYTDIDNKDLKRIIESYKPYIILK